MLATTKLYNILLHLAFENSTYTDIQKFILEIPSYEILLQGALYLFDFPYDVPENFEAEEFKKYFCGTFASRFFDECINFETEQAFMIRLRSLTQQIMPFYSRKIAILKNTNLENFKNIRTFESQRETTGNVTNNSNAKSNAKSNSNGIGKSANSDFPNKLMTYDDVFKKPAYLSTGSVNETENNSNIDSTNDSKSITDENRKENINSKETSGSIFDFTKNFSEFGTVWQELMNEYNSLFFNLM